MRVAVDLDDVLADLISCLIATHRQMNGVSLTREQAVNWHVFPLPVHDRIRFGGGYATLVPLPGAREFLAWLRPQAEVFIVTYRGDHAKETTEAWLARHFSGLYDGVRYTGGSKVDACRDLRVDLIVDDSCHQVPAVTAALGIPGVLMDAPMNRHIAETALIRRARDLAQARCLIRQFRGQNTQVEP